MPRRLQHKQKKKTQIKMNLWPYNMIRLWDSKEVFHTKSNICHFPSETVPQLLQNRAAWEKPSNGAKTQPRSSVPSYFPVYFRFNFYLRFLFLFLFGLCQKLKVSFTFSFLFAFSFFVCVWAFWASVQYRLYYVTLSNVNFILFLLG